METKLVIQYSRPVFQLMGEAALLIRMGEGIDAVVNQKVHSLTRTLRNNLACGVEEIIPGYSTLLVRFNPEQVTASEITGWVNIQYELLHIGVPEVHRLITIPTVYGGSYGPDLEFVAGHCQMSTAEVIRLHSEQEYPVFFIGFLPGFPYLGGMNPRLETPRLEIPRTVLPAGSVGIAGLQTGIYPLASPGGWRIIGQTPLMLFNPQCDPLSLLQPGDRVRFVPCNSWKEASHGV